ncbi:hypothetical protein HLB44_16120 [Aquincola sp. S2]|uniref:Uncharacterized protein n=1 Tax=Pseudaquabacterium terrae TaxID=2732868 RepID=A0ABX2EIQ9_9BURK|nr:hypothetical protein [Aquabacterium terrae]NRF68522.1 hypothetical protein [Aquabacterium terrae]
MRIGVPLAALACAMAIPAVAAVTTFDPATGLVTIPSVDVGGSSFISVTLQHQGNYVFKLQSYVGLDTPMPAVASYDLTSETLTIPAVQVGDFTYLDVTLKHTGDLNFSLTGATQLEQSVVDEIRSIVVARDAGYAFSVPTGAAAVQYLDRCWRHDGVTRDAVAGGHPAGDAHDVGRTTEKITVTGSRRITNPNGSARREIHVELDVRHANGSVSKELPDRVISGSSSGTFRCPSEQAEEKLRFYGNQQFAGITAGWRTTRASGYSIVTGAPLSPPTVWRRDMQFQVIEPLGRTNYAVVTGPGIGSRKLISPYLMRSEPVLAGKRGNYINLASDHPFLMCRAPGNATPLASAADCVAEGASGYDVGLSAVTPNAAADAGFAALGWAQYGVYRFDLYEGDGWKIVNGHTGVTPLETYYRLLPYIDSMNFVNAATAIPALAPTTLTGPQLAANVNSATPSPVDFSWSAFSSPHSSQSFRLYQGWNVHQGPKTGNAAGNAWPAYRSITPFALADGSVRKIDWPIAPRPGEQASKTYSDFTLQYRDGRGNEVLSVDVLQ